MCILIDESRARRVFRHPSLPWAAPLPYLFPAERRLSLSWEKSSQLDGSIRHTPPRRHRVAGQGEEERQLLFRPLLSLSLAPAKQKSLRRRSAFSRLFLPPFMPSAFPSLAHALLLSPSFPQSCFRTETTSPAEHRTARSSLGRARLSPFGECSCHERARAREAPQEEPCQKPGE